MFLVVVEVMVAMMASGEGVMVWAMDSVMVRAVTMLSGNDGGMW